MQRAGGLLRFQGGIIARLTWAGYSEVLREETSVEGWGRGAERARHWSASGHVRGEPRGHHGIRRTNHHDAPATTSHQTRNAPPSTTIAQYNSIIYDVIYCAFHAC